ncbi:MAG: hypothetical protein K1X78_28270 [Verrucomicrobiaceae bacterium]|nr:hypothetical protein [Verrucomicrobiaceae bacterium]
MHPQTQPPSSQPRFLWRYTAAVLASLMVTDPLLLAAPPAWWTNTAHPERNVAPSPLAAQRDDFSAANIGQLKTLARKAMQAMDDAWPGFGAGTAIHTMVGAWEAAPAAGVMRDDYSVVNAGQLKTVAKPFYDRLAQLGLRSGSTGIYPWILSVSPADDYAVVNVGQLKTIFAFEIPANALTAITDRAAAVQANTALYLALRAQVTTTLAALTQAWYALDYEISDLISVVIGLYGEGLEEIVLDAAYEMLFAARTDAGVDPSAPPVIGPAAPQIWASSSETGGAASVQWYDELSGLHIVPPPAAPLGDYLKAARWPLPAEVSYWLPQGFGNSFEAGRSTQSENSGLNFTFVSSHLLAMAATKPVLSNTWQHYAVVVSENTVGLDDRSETYAGIVTLNLAAGQQVGMPLLIDAPQPVAGRNKVIEFRPIQPIQGSFDTVELHMCRWLSADPDGGGVNTAMFPEGDGDRFVIRLPIKAAPNQTTIQVQVSTAPRWNDPFGYFDPGALLTFHNTGGDYFESDPLALVTDRDDDGLAVGAGVGGPVSTDGAAGDSTFLAEPGGELLLNSPDLVGGTSISIPIQTYTHQIHVQNIFLNFASGEEEDAQVLITDNLRRLKEIYNQIHVEVIVNSTLRVTTTSIKNTIGGRTPDSTSYTSLVQAIETTPGVDGVDVFKLVWISKKHDHFQPALGRNLVISQRPDYVCLFLAHLNEEPNEGKKSIVAAHEVGHFCLALDKDHSVSPGVLYAPHHLMCASDRSHGIVVGRPDQSAKHWQESWNGGVNTGDEYRIKHSALQGLCKPIPY